MALIYCKNCGNQISDKAPSCPHCGALPDMAQRQTTSVIYGSQTQKPKRHTGVIVLVVLIVLASIIAAVLIPVKLAADEHKNGTYSSSIYTGNSIYTSSSIYTDNSIYTSSPEKNYTEVYSTPEQTYPVKLMVTAEPSVLGKNPFGEYDVNVYVDGTNVGTIPNIGECLTDDSIGAALVDDEALNEKSTTINMKLSAGKHDLKFISSDNEKVYAEGYYIDVDRSCTLRYRLICRTDEIEVRIRK